MKEPEERRNELLCLGRTSMSILLRTNMDLHYTQHGTTQPFFERRQDNLGTKGEMNAPHRHAMQFMVSARHDRILLGSRHEISTVQLRTKQFLQGASRYRRATHSAVDDDPASQQTPSHAHVGRLVTGGREVKRSRRAKEKLARFRNIERRLAHPHCQENFVRRCRGAAADATNLLRMAS
jgi:hypothetical protein